MIIIDCVKKINLKERAKNVMKGLKDKDYLKEYTIISSF